MSHLRLVEMQKLLRITTKYMEVEDRVRMNAECSDGDYISLWLTQRLLIRLAKNCIEFLDKQPLEVHKIPAADERLHPEAQSIMQQSATTGSQNQEAVVVKNNSQSYFIREIDIKHSSEGIVLVFRETEDKQAMLILNFEQLRRWLNIVCSIWRKADWPMEIWPDWVAIPDDHPSINDKFLH